MLVTIENFNQQEKEIFKQIINTVLKDKFIFIDHNPNEFNEILRNSGYFDLNYQTKMLVALAELNELYFRDLSKLFNKYQFIITENYFDCLFINFTQIHFDKKMKAQMKLADRYNAKFSIIIGDSELENGQYVVKDMKTYDQENVEFDNIVKYLEEKLKGEK